jgi:hypothetical protein
MLQVVGGWLILKLSIAELTSMRISGVYQTLTFADELGVEQKKNIQE